MAAVKFDLKQVGSQMLEDLKESFGTRNLVRLKLDLAFLELYEGDPNALTKPVKMLAEFVARNIINGTITIEFNQSQANGNIDLCVILTGSSVPEYGVSEMFKPRFKLENEFETVAQSIPFKTNFGLDNQNIHIDFIAPLPQTKEPDKNNRFQNKRVLIAEDNPVSAMVFSSFLADLDIIYEVAKNGEEALQWLSKGQFDLVLMDIYMPVMDGVEAIQILRKSNPKLPVIVLSASSFKQDRENAMQAGANLYLQKPISQNDLHEALDKFF